MIKSHEIAVGNVLLKNGVPVIIDGRSIFDIWQFEQQGVTEMSYSGFPLSEKVLENLGYRACSLRDNHYTVQGHTIWLCNDMFVCDKNGVVLKTAHQVQNLCFQLIKRKLTYEIR